MGKEMHYYGFVKYNEPQGRGFAFGTCQKEICYVGYWHEGHPKGYGQIYRYNENIATFIIQWGNFLGSKYDASQRIGYQYNIKICPRLNENTFEESIGPVADSTITKFTCEVDRQTFVYKCEPDARNQFQTCNVSQPHVNQTQHITYHVGGFTTKVVETCQ